MHYLHFFYSKPLNVGVALSKNKFHVADLDVNYRFILAKQLFSLSLNIQLTYSLFICVCWDSLSVHGALRNDPRFSRNHLEESITPTAEHACVFMYMPISNTHEHFKPLLNKYLSLTKIWLYVQVPEQHGRIIGIMRGAHKMSTLHSGAG